MAMGSIGPMELLLLGVVALLLFGPNKLPEIGRQLGRGMRDFKQALEGSGVKDALDSVSELRSAVNPIDAARSFVGSGEETEPSELPEVTGVVTPTADAPAALENTAAPEDALLAVEPVGTQPDE
jgi:sec-independent protein translocase protein TatA